jgi:hypothetical protein
MPGLTVDETRVVDVLAANAALAGAGEDPLWPAPGDGAPVATPAGWCWAHLGLSRRLALVPIELHGSYRHAGGVRMLPVDPARRGLCQDPDTEPVSTGPGDEVPEEILADLEELLGYALPATYRQYLAATNGAAPAVPAVLDSLGFIADQPLFGLARRDQQQDLWYARDWLGDRFTPDLLAIGYVQGGLLAVELTGPAADAVWYWDDDDPRDDAGFDAAYIRQRLLHRCADSFAEFWAALRQPAAALVTLANELASDGRVRPVREELAGSGLPKAMRAPWQPAPDKRRDPIVDLFDLP